MGVIRFALAFVLVALAVRSASADPAAAERLATEAGAAADANNFQLAATKFTEAYKEDPTRSDVFCNIGISYFKVGELPRAHLLLTQCVQRALDMTFKDKANAVIASVEQQLRAENHTPVTITVKPSNATITITEFGSESQFVGARTIWLRFGTHHLEAKLDGFRSRSVTVDTIDQKPAPIEITLEKEPEIAGPIGGPKPPKPPGAPSKILPIVTTGITVAALGLTVLAITKARDSAERGAFAIDQEALDDEKSEVSKWNLIMGVSGTVTILAATASGYLWYRATRSHNALEVKPTPGGAAVTFGGRF